MELGTHFNIRFGPSSRFKTSYKGQKWAVTKIDVHQCCTKTHGLLQTVSTLRLSPGSGSFSPAIAQCCLILLPQCFARTCYWCEMTVCLSESYLIHPDITLRLAPKHLPPTCLVHLLTPPHDSLFWIYSKTAFEIHFTFMNIFQSETEWEKREVIGSSWC